MALTKSKLTNQEIITIEAFQKGFNYTGDNLYTFVEWHEQGYSIVKGQKAFITTRLWSKGINKRLRVMYLFKHDQVIRNLDHVFHIVNN